MDTERHIRAADYGPAITALTPVLHNLPGKIVVIDGRPGVGKTTFGRYLAWYFNISLVETDLFMIEGQGKPVHRTEDVARIIKFRLNIPRPIIVEGATALRLLKSTGHRSDFHIHVTNGNAPENSKKLEADLVAYDAEFKPHEADITLALDHSI